jgi:GT2 family glycosyltransferase
LDKIAVVILNWNGVEMLKQFLPSVLENSKEAKIYVADNASTDNSVQSVKNDFPTVSIIENKENNGYSAGYNEALSQIEADYFVLLNSDVEVSSGWLNSIVAMMDADKQIAACQPKILSFKDKSMFEYAGAAGGFIDKDGYMFCRGRIFDHFEKDEGQYDGTKEIFWASGACLFVRSSIFHETGGLDEGFFAHMEEIDLCWRFKNRGYKVMYNSDSVVYHVGGGTLSKNNPTKTYLNFRNNLFLLTKNYFQGNFAWKLFYRFILDGLAAIKFLVDGHVDHSWAIARAHFSFYSKFRIYHKKRKEVKKTVMHFNAVGQFRKSIILRYFIGGVRKFSDLKERNFK